MIARGDMAVFSVAVCTVGMICGIFSWERRFYRFYVKFTQNLTILLSRKISVDK